eukprot:g6357.t1
MEVCDLLVSIVKAASMGHVSLLSQLLEALSTSQISLKSESEVKVSALVAAAKSGFVDTAALLLRKETNVNGLNTFPGNVSMTPLYIATWMNRVSMVKLLIQNGANPNIVSMIPKKNTKVMWKHTPLSAAVHRGNIDCVRLLLAASANPDFRGGFSGWTPLIEASYTNKASICQLLLNAGANFDLTDAYGRSPEYFCKSIIVKNLLIEERYNRTWRNWSILRVAVFLKLRVREWLKTYYLPVSGKFEKTKAILYNASHCKRKRDDEFDYQLSHVEKRTLRCRRR